MGRTKLFFKLAALMAAVTFASTLLFAINDEFIVIDHIVYFFVATFFLNKFNKSNEMTPGWKLAAIFVGFLFFLLFAGVGRASTVGALGIFIGDCFGILGGFFFYLFPQKYIRVGIGILSFSFAVFYYKVGYDLCEHQLIYGNFDGATHEKVRESFRFVDEDGHVLPMNNLRDKYLVLCTWNTKYGWYCREFEKFRPIYDKYKKKENMAFYIVGYNVDNFSVLHDSFNRIKNEFKIDIPYLITEDAYSFIDQTNISKEWCNVLILKDDEIIFRGDIAHAERMLATLPSSPLQTQVE